MSNSVVPWLLHLQTQGVNVLETPLPNAELELQTDGSYVTQKETRVSNYAMTTEWSVLESGKLLSTLSSQMAEVFVLM